MNTDIMFGGLCALGIAGLIVGGVFFARWLRQLKRDINGSE